jgi:lysophospholipase L1-like esterase
VAIGLGAGVVLAEIALRVFHVVPLADVATVNESEFVRVPGIYRPHQDYVDREIPELPYRVRINALGYRGPELTIAKPEGETRVLMIGDSFVYGDFVEDDETLPAQLEAALDGPCSLRVVNAGLRGGTIVGTSQMLQRGLALDPDLALVVFTENDVRDLASPIWYSLERNRDLKSRPPLSFLYPVLRHTALWNLAMQWRATRRASAARAPKAVDDPPVEKESAGITSKEQRLRTGYEERLALLAERLRQWRVPLVLAIYPSHRSIDGGQSEQIDWLLGVTDSLEIETINLYPGLAAYPASDTYLIPIDGHPSSRGYSIAAESLAERLATMEPLHACLGGPESGP